MDILAIDPGETQSHFIIWTGEQVTKAWSGPNDELIPLIQERAKVQKNNLCVVIEGFDARGNRLGNDSLLTIEWYGRFFQSIQDVSPTTMCSIVRRSEVKKYLGGKDNTAIRIILIDRFGQKPAKKRPNKVYGNIKLAEHQWQAFALAVTVMDKMQEVDTRDETI